MAVSSGRYAYSTDEVSYHGDCATPEEAVYEADADAGVTVWVGEIVPYTTRSFAPDGWQIIEALQECCADVVGIDNADGWLSYVSRPALADLELRLVDLVDAWLTAHHLGPDFFTVENVREHVVGVS